MEWHSILYFHSQYRNVNASRMAQSPGSNSPLVTSGSYQFPTYGLAVVVKKNPTTRGSASMVWEIGMNLSWLVGNYFSFHSWQAARERKSPVPSSHSQWIGSYLYFFIYILLKVSVSINLYGKACNSKKMSWGFFFPWNSVSQENSPMSRRSTFRGKMFFFINL